MPTHAELATTTSVLLIDGNEFDRKHFAGLLKGRSSDYKVIEAVDGQSGLDVCHSRQIDCVVVEISLPDRSGFEVLMTLVPRASKPHIPVIVLTQRAHRGLCELATNNGGVCLPG
jgi:CheY-like chemotaxis protein